MTVIDTTTTTALRRARVCGSIWHCLAAESPIQGTAVHVGQIGVNFTLLTRKAIAAREYLTSSRVLALERATKHGVLQSDHGHTSYIHYAVARLSVA